MSFITDRKFASFVSVRLEGFKWERNNLGRAKCPFCTDSLKKRRFYLYQTHRAGADVDRLNCHCHNCNYTASFGNFLKEFDPSLYSEYRLENFAESSAWRKFATPKEEPKEPAKPSFPLAPQFKAPPHTQRIDKLPADHPARLYIEGRKLDRLDLFYYSPDFQKTVEAFREDLKEKAGHEERIIIPFFDEEGNMQTFQGRSMDPNVPQSQRYLTFKSSDSASKVFGLERLNRKATITVVEGPFDSTLVPNCVATADGNLLTVDWGTLYIPDNQYRNEQVCKLIDRIIERGKKVVLFPESVRWKDLNDMVQKGGMTQRELLQLIASNVHEGLKARMVFTGLRKA